MTDRLFKIRRKMAKEQRFKVMSKAEIANLFKKGKDSIRKAQKNDLELVKVV